MWGRQDFQNNMGNDAIKDRNYSKIDPDDPNIHKATLFKHISTKYSTRSAIPHIPFYTHEIKPHLSTCV